MANQEHPQPAPKRKSSDQDRLSAIAIVSGVPAFGNMSELYEFCRLAAASGMLPSGIKDANQAAVVAVAGMDLGVSALQAWQNIAIVHGRPTPYGDLTAYRLDNWKQFIDREEWWEVDGERVDRRPIRIKPGDDVAAVCKITYKRGEEIRVKESYFHLSEAEEAGLYPGKDRNGNFSAPSPWNRYTARMLMWKARNWGARDIYPDVLKGFQEYGEAMDADPVAREAEYEVVDADFEPPEDDGNEAFEANEEQDEDAAEKASKREEEEFQAFRRAKAAEVVTVPAQDSKPAAAAQEELEAAVDELERQTPDPAPEVEAKASAIDRIYALNELPRTELSAILADMEVDEDVRKAAIGNLFPGTPPSSLSKAQLARLVFFLETDQDSGRAPSGT